VTGFLLFFPEHPVLIFNCQLSIYNSILSKKWDFLYYPATKFMPRLARLNAPGVLHAYELREPPAPYGKDFDVKNGCLRLENTYLWNIFTDISIR